MSGNTGSGVKSGIGTFAVAILDTTDEPLAAIDELPDTIAELLDRIDALLDATDNLLDTVDERLDMINALELKDASLDATLATGALDAITATEEGAGLAFPSSPPSLPPQAIIKVDVLTTRIRSKPRITTSGRYFISALIE